MARKRSKTTAQSETPQATFVNIGHAVGRAYADLVCGLQETGLEPREAHSLAVLTFSRALGTALSSLFVLQYDDGYGADNV